MGLQGNTNGAIMVNMDNKNTPLTPRTSPPSQRRLYHRFHDSETKIMSAKLPFLTPAQINARVKKKWRSLSAEKKLTISNGMSKTSSSPGLKGGFFAKRIFLGGATNIHTLNINEASKTHCNHVRSITAHTTLWNEKCDDSNKNASAAVDRGIEMRGSCRTKGLRSDFVVHNTHDKSKTPPVLDTSVKQLDGMPTKRVPKLSRGPLRRSKRLACTISKDGGGDNEIESRTQMKTPEMRETVSKINNFTNVKLRKRVLPDAVMQEYEFNDNVEEGVQSKQTALSKAQYEMIPERCDAKGLSKSSGVQKAAQAEGARKKKSSTRARRSSNNSIPVEKIMSKMENVPESTEGPKSFKRIYVAHKYLRRHSSRIQAPVSLREKLKSGAEEQGTQKNLDESLNSSEEEGLLVTRRDYPEMYNEDQSQVSTHVTDSLDEVSNNVERKRNNSHMTSSQERDAMTENESSEYSLYNGGRVLKQVEKPNSTSSFGHKSGDDNDTGLIEGYKNDCTDQIGKGPSDWSESDPLLLRRYEIDCIDQTSESHSDWSESVNSTIQTDTRVTDENDVFNCDSRYIIWQGEHEPIRGIDDETLSVKTLTGKAICDSFSQFCSQQSSLLNSSQEDDCVNSSIDDSPRTPPVASSVKGEECASGLTYCCDIDSGTTSVVDVETTDVQTRRRTSHGTEAKRQEPGREQLKDKGRRLEPSKTRKSKESTTCNSDNFLCDMFKDLVSEQQPHPKGRSLSRIISSRRDNLVGSNFQTLFTEEGFFL